ncbi:DODA-type extradiol aromatic ring-opening family dioxygenase [Methanobacterium aggregans]|uniref:DODA-type extradiol aromatic ring-opening family dioxygenase n=1 Tax=Methanobacterium aggregans TaxID=1615586 RepID=UPI00320DCB45
MAGKKQGLSPIFVSHGAPTLPLEDIPARKFLKGLGSHYSNIKAVLCISAHWATSIPTVNAVERPETIHDFYGFPEELYQMEYPAGGDPELAEHLAELIQSEGISCNIDVKRGLDHGAWVPLMLMFPNADIPIIQLSIQNHLNPFRHLELGRAIKDLRNEGVLIVGSGGAVHPLGYAGFHFGGQTDEWAIDFDDWLTDAVLQGDENLLTNYRNLAPYPERAHPYPDHYMPLLVAFGAAGKGAKGKVIHHSWYAGDLGMAAYSFQVDE